MLAWLRRFGLSGRIVSALRERPVVGLGQQH
jgi:hypothetical protein